MTSLKTNILVELLKSTLKDFHDPYPVKKKKAGWELIFIYQEPIG